jgi:hypothetical protein
VYRRFLILKIPFFEECHQLESLNPAEIISDTAALFSRTPEPQMVAQEQWEHQQSTLTLVVPVSMNHVFRLLALQPITMPSTSIEILSQPRPEFRPRTEKEYRESTHNIRCSKGSRHEYPTIKVHPTLCLRE